MTGSTLGARRTRMPKPSTDCEVRPLATLGAGRLVLREYLVEQTAPDGTTRSLRREACHRSDSVAVLPYSRRRRTVVLTRQLRLPVLLSDPRGQAFLEAPGGLVEDEDPQSAARRELEEETGYSIEELIPVVTAFMSPASMTERVHLFLADLDTATRAAIRPHADEPIEALEIPIATAVAMVGRGEIADGRTILLLEHLRLSGDLR